nr:helix-turn-helix transcriptional regulator [Eubacterium sp.]
MKLDEKTTNELNQMLKSCATLSHLEDTLTELPDKDRLTLKAYLEEMLQKKGCNKADVIREANLARTYGYQIFQGERLASRDKLIALAVAMGMNLEECNRLLTIAQAGILYSKNRRDAILIFGFEKGLSFIDMNELLYEMGEDVLE